MNTKQKRIKSLMDNSELRRINVLKNTKKALSILDKIGLADLYVFDTGKLYKGNCHITSNGKVYSGLRPRTSCLRLTWRKPKKK